MHLPLLQNRSDRDKPIEPVARFAAVTGGGLGGTLAGSSFGELMGKRLSENNGAFNKVLSRAEEVSGRLRTAKLESLEAQLSAASQRLKPVGAPRKLPGELTFHDYKKLQDKLDAYQDQLKYEVVNRLKRKTQHVPGRVGKIVGGIGGALTGATAAYLLTSPSIRKYLS